MRLIFRFGTLISLLLLIIVIELSRRNRLDRNSFFLWLSVAIGIGIISFSPSIAGFLASLVDLEYTHVFTSTIGLVLLLFLNIYTLSKVMEQRRRINKLVQEIALED